MANVLLDIVDDIDLVRHPNEALWMAASDLATEHASPLHTLIDVVGEKLTDVRDRLNAYREAPQAEDAANV